MATKIHPVQSGRIQPSSDQASNSSNQDRVSVRQATGNSLWMIVKNCFLCCTCHSSNGSASPKVSIENTPMLTLTAKLTTPHTSTTVQVAPISSPLFQDNQLHTIHETQSIPLDSAQPFSSTQLPPLLLPGELSYDKTTFNMERVQPSADSIGLSNVKELPIKCPSTPPYQLQEYQRTLSKVIQLQTIPLIFLSPPSNCEKNSTLASNPAHPDKDLSTPLPMPAFSGTVNHLEYTHERSSIEHAHANITGVPRKLSNPGFVHEKHSTSSLENLSGKGLAIPQYPNLLNCLPKSISIEQIISTPIYEADCSSKLLSIFE